MAPHNPTKIANSWRSTEVDTSNPDWYAHNIWSAVGIEVSQIDEEYLN